MSFQSMSRSEESLNPFHRRRVKLGKACFEHIQAPSKRHSDNAA